MESSPNDVREKTKIDFFRKKKSRIVVCIVFVLMLFFALIMLLSDSDISVTLSFRSQGQPQMIEPINPDYVVLPSPTSIIMRPPENETYPVSEALKGQVSHDQNGPNPLLGRWQKEKETRPALLEFLDDRLCFNWSSLNQKDYFCTKYIPYRLSGDTLFHGNTLGTRWRIVGEKLEMTELASGTKEVYIRVSLPSEKPDISQLTEKERQTISRTTHDPYRGFSIQYPPLFETFNRVFQPMLFRNFHSCLMPVNHEGIPVRDFATSKYVEVYQNEDVRECVPVSFQTYFSEYKKNIPLLIETIPVKTKGGQTAYIFHRTMPNFNIDTGITTNESDYEIFVELPAAYIGEYRALKFNYYPQSIRGGLICGDNFCDANETQAFCPSDCKEQRNIKKLIQETFATLTFSDLTVFSKRTIKTPIVMNWKTYVNEDYSFSIQYPAEWEVYTFPYPKTVEQWKDFGNYTGYNLVSIGTKPNPDYPEWHEGFSLSIDVSNQYDIWGDFSEEFFKKIGLSNVGDESRVQGVYDNLLGKKHITIGGRDGLEQFGLVFAQYLFDVDVYNSVRYNDLLYQINWRYDYDTPAGVPIYQKMRDSFKFIPAGS
ncbi:MAG: hypothetical protein G01um101448_829 [Parcubacteria group bacterium Gr01-1014_48]|nr:MAG: hypothetical protein Greene041614_320 [Parcubacteria group bacterium Greene0416_14]TSC73300.1 MAG: hypothetical protein G01um101448_829 [Parcubacteria group bacterium Gr01-1014_48]TSC99719.1 MAG: hypothetical protein Greene101415_1121 [Parcubacteria group bacterium Greene1014_15]TSD07774.1 MAG: hypothetical protein Greene07144_731 [Parcubacteria group bacterium Greene0714_4]